MAQHITTPSPVLDKLHDTATGVASVAKGSKSLLAALRTSRVLAALMKPPAVLLLLVTLVVGRGITRGEFFFYGDEMRHAMNGVLIRDLIVDFPIHHPLQYIYEYYAKYPATAFPHWPPLFYGVEGVLFLVFGLSPWVSRLAILLFALLAAYSWYRIAVRLGPPRRAFLSALALMCLPFILLYERVTMLEIPALGICLAAILYWLKFVETERRRDLWILAGLVAASFLTSQKAAFLPFLVVTDLVVERRFRLLRRVDVWLASLVSIAVVSPWYYLAVRNLDGVIARAVGNNYGYFGLAANYTFYLSKVYTQLGPIVLGLACIGFVIALTYRTRANRFLSVWLLSGYVCFVLINEKDPRHTMAWIPPLIYLAMVAVESFFGRRSWAWISSAALTAILLVNAVRTTRPIVSGEEDAARFVLSLPESEVIYYQGYLVGDFVFYARKFDPEKRHLIAREKQVVASRLGHEARRILRTPDQVLAFFQNWGIRYAVLDDHDDVPGLEVVRDLMRSGQFELVRTFPIFTNQANEDLHHIQVFRYLGELRRASGSQAIPMMTIRNDIPVDLSRLAGRPWPN